MSIPLSINGETYNYPETGDTDWGSEATDWAEAVTVGMLQKAGGLFQLLDEVDFGTAFGVKSLYYKTRSSNIATVGQFRLANDDLICWRNNANDGDLSLTVDANDALNFNGTSITVGGDPVQVAITPVDTATIDLTLDGSNNLSADINIDSIDNSMIASAAAIAYSKLDLASSIVNADVSASAAIAYSKLSLANSIVNADVAASAAIAYSKLNLVGSIVNADVNASAAISYSKLNLSSSIVNADINASAAIDASKIANGTVSNTEFQYLSGVTSDIQTQLDSALTNPMTTAGDIIYGGVSGAPTRLAKTSLVSQALMMDPTSSIPFWGDPGLEYDTINAPTTLGASHRGKLLFVDASLAGFNIDLPAVASSAGYYVTLMRLDSSAFTVAIDGNGSETIQPGNTTTKTFSRQWQWMRLYCNGLTWIIVGFGLGNPTRTATSSTKTPSADGYPDMTGNSLSLPQGEYELGGSGVFENSGGSAGFSEIGLGFYAADGANSAVTPAALSTVVSELSNRVSIVGLNPYVTGLTGISYYTTNAQTIFIRVPSGGATIYLVPYSVQTTEANARITVALWAQQTAF